MDIRILGLGNVLMSDDGFGPYVVRVLEAFYELPAGVQAVDAGTPGVDLTPFLLDARAVIVIDTVKAQGMAGDIRTYDRDDILGHPSQQRGARHDAGLREALLTVSAAGAGPSNVKLIGVIPEWIATGVTLSRNVRAAVAPAIGLIVTELERLGARPVMRPVPRRPDTWWERETVTAPRPRPSAFVRGKN